MVNNKKKKTTNEGKPKKPSTPIEEVLGTTLLTPLTPQPEDAPKSDMPKVWPTKSTKEIVKGKEFILLYFSNNLNYHCEEFMPLLVEFYNKHAETGKFEIVFVSSDRNLKEFDEKYGKMPWKAVPNYDDGYLVKKNLAEKLRISKLPVLLALQAETGLYLTNKTHVKIRDLWSREYAKPAVDALLEEWRKIEPKTLEEGAKDAEISSLFMQVLMNPIWIFALIYAYKWIKDNWQSSGGVEGGEL